MLGIATSGLSTFPRAQLTRRNHPTMSQVRLRKLVIAVMLGVCVTAPAAAQRRRSSGSSRHPGTGIPCGQSYISASKTCHIAPTTVPPDTTPAAPVLPVAVVGTAAPMNSGLSQSSTAPPLGIYPEFLVPLEGMIGFRALLRNTPISDGWIKAARIVEVHPDHLLLVADDKQIRLPLSSIEFYFIDPKDSGSVTLVLRKG